MCPLRKRAPWHTRGVVDQAVVDALYDAFASYQLAPEIGYCAYCDDADYERALHGDLRSLPSNVVDKYIWDAIHHTGDEHDFKHFLPRVYELVASGELPTADPEMAIGRLAQAGWSEWPEPERQPVLRLLDAIWEDTMTLPQPPIGIEELVCGLDLAFDGVPPQLTRWRHDPRPTAKRRLAEFVIANADELPNRSLSDSWWSGAGEKEVVTWLLAGETLECLVAAVRDDPNDEATQRAVDVLRLATGASQ
jgi:hypothetical protein